MDGFELFIGWREWFLTTVIVFGITGIIIWLG